MNETSTAQKVAGGAILVIAALVVAVRLGAEIFVAWANVPVEPSFTTLWDYYQAYPTADVQKMVLGSAGLALVPMVLIGILFAVGLRPKRKLFGEARFANKSEITKAGLFKEDGIILGKLDSRYLMYQGESHVCVAAPTRGGKGVGIVIPNLLNWRDSVVCLDIKQENWNLTSGFRARYGQQCFLFNPAAKNGKTHRWNPLAYISEEPGQRINDVQKIAAMIWPDPTDGGDPIWTASCRSLFLGIVLYQLEREGHATLGAVLRFGMAAAPKRLRALLEETEGELSESCVSALNDYLDTSDNTRTSIRKSFTSRLELWLNPMVDAATSGNDFDLRELRRTPMSIYIGITPDDLDRLTPLVNLLFQQIIDLNTQMLPEEDKSLERQCLLLMDEFMAIGRIPILAKGISYIAGYGLRIMAIFQSPGQVRDPRMGYGHEAAETLFDNMEAKVVFAPPNIKIAKEISEELGNDTVTKWSKGKSGQALKEKNQSLNQSDHSRALLLPQEVKEIGEWKEIVLLRNVKPIHATKIRYFQDRVFVDRLRETAPSLADVKVVGKSELSGAIAKGELAAHAPVITANVSALSAARMPVVDGFIDASEELDLSEFSADFSSIEVPAGELGEDDITELAATFYGVMQNDQGERVNG